MRFSEPLRLTASSPAEQSARLTLDLSDKKAWRFKVTNKKPGIAAGLFRLLTNPWH